MRWLAAELPVDVFHDGDVDEEEEEDPEEEEDDHEEEVDDVDDKVGESPQEEHVVRDLVLSRPNLTASLEKRKNHQYLEIISPGNFTQITIGIWH